MLALNILLRSELLELEKIHINDNGADVLIKALPKKKFETCCLITDMANILTEWEGNFCQVVGGLTMWEPTKSVWLEVKEKKMQERINVFTETNLYIFFDWRFILVSVGVNFLTLSSKLENL